MRDTVFEVHTDTITTVVEVERKLSTVEKVKMWLAEKVLWLIAAIVLLLALKRFLN